MGNALSTAANPPERSLDIAPSGMQIITGFRQVRVIFQKLHITPLVKIRIAEGQVGKIPLLRALRIQRAIFLPRQCTAFGDIRKIPKQNKLFTVITGRMDAQQFLYKKQRFPLVEDAWIEACGLFG